MEIINPARLLVQIAPILDKLKLPYFITGGFAVSVWGRPRATFDIDIVIQIREPDAKQLITMLRKISEYGYIDEDAVKEAIRNAGEFNFIDPETGVKVDFWVSSDKNAHEYERVVIKVVDGQKVNFISPEDLILSKLKWYKISPSSRHLEDVDSILKISKKILDKQYLKKMSVKLDLEDELRQVLKNK